MVDRKRSAKPAPRTAAKSPEAGGRNKAEKGKGKAPAAVGKTGAVEAGAGTAKATAPMADAAPIADQKAAAPDPPVRLHMPEPPKGPSPATMKRIQGVQARAAGKAAAQADLPPAEKQVGDAQKAVTPPDAERAARAQADLIAAVKAAPSPEIVKLCQKIRKVIREKRPADEDALDGGRSRGRGGRCRQPAQRDGRRTRPRRSRTITARSRPARPLRPRRKARRPAGAARRRRHARGERFGGEARRGARGATCRSTRMPPRRGRRPRTRAWTRPPRQLVQSGPIAEARAAQGELDQTAKEDPAKVLARQEQALGKAEADMAALAGAGARGARRPRARERSSAPRRGQRGMVGSEESMRPRPARRRRRRSSRPRRWSRALLKDLPQNAMEEWEQAKKLLVDKFKNDLAIVKKRVDERHSGVGGFFVAIVGRRHRPARLGDRRLYARREQFRRRRDREAPRDLDQGQRRHRACDELIRTARETIAKIVRRPAGIAASLGRPGEGEVRRTARRAAQRRSRTHATTSTRT